MKKMTNRVVHELLLSLALFSLGGLSVAAASGDAGFRNIHDIHIEGTAFATVTASGPAFANPDNCGSSNLVVIQTSDTQYNQKLALVLAAFSQGTQVDFWLMGCISTPWGYTAPLVYAIDVSVP